jgi:predicted dienelactone hydrolase
MRARCGPRPWLCLLPIVLGASPWAVAATPAKLERRCHAEVGRATTRCLKDYVAAVGRCRDAADAACEAGLRTPDATLATILADLAAPIRQTCTDASAERISLSLGVERHVHYVAEACQKWAEYFLDTAYADDPGALSADDLACQRDVARRLARLQDKVIAASGACNAALFAGHDCRRSRRDRRIADGVGAARRGILRRCGAALDRLALVAPGDGPTLEARLDVLLDRVVVPARHFALRVYPQLNLGPTALFGPAPVGVRTIDLVDPSRQNPTGTGPRAFKVEIYYPSTAAAVAGVARDIVKVFGIELFPTPTYRDVARAPGPFPLVVYSHGSGGIRFENLELAVHLASHGYVVVSADHPGDTLLDPGDDMNSVLTNRPLDVSFLIDQFLAFDQESGNFFAGAIDADRIAVAGWSYGGYTALALAAGSFYLGTFTDPRVKAILPLDGSAHAFEPDVPTIFSTITVPTLLLGGSYSDFLAPRLQQLFDTLPSGASLVGYGNFLRAVHPSFADQCEVPEVLRGVSAACEPDVLPWRHVRHIENYLALNFFDGTLGGSADALARLEPVALADVEDLAYQRK